MSSRSLSLSRAPAPPLSASSISNHALSPSGCGGSACCQAPHARLHECDLLISVLECFMLQTIRANEREELASCQTMYTTPNAFFAPQQGPPEPSVFHALQPPSITPVEYLKRLARYSFCSRSVFVAAFFYLERVAKVKNVDLKINGLSVHRLLLTAVLLATKVIDDVLYDNAHFAKVGGLDVSELNMLELDMLKVLEFNLFIKMEDFEAFEEKLLSEAMNTCLSDYSMLPGRLTNLGFGLPQCSKDAGLKVAPSSPPSTMDVCFSNE